MHVTALVRQMSHRVEPPAKTYSSSQAIRRMLPAGEYKRRVVWTAILPFAKLLWSLLRSPGGFRDPV